MDYSFLENIPSSLTQIPVYSPDFGFLSTMQGRANQQYEAGLSEVKNTYGAIFNQPVTGAAMQQRQQMYAKQAQQQLQDISAQDLSNPKNILSAEQIMAPFYKDKLLVQNIGLTASGTQNMQLAHSYRDSSDKEKRALYNPIIDNYISNGLEQLANAPLTQEAYSKLSPREFTPIIDTEAAADKSWAELYGKDGGIKTTDANGEQMTITTNGPQSFAAYKAYMTAFQQRPEYATQNRIIATTLMENDMKSLRDQYPNVDEGTLKQKFSEQLVDQVKHYYANGITNARKSALEWRMKNSKYLNLDANGNPVGGKITVPDKATEAQVMFNLSQAKAHEQIATDLEQRFSNDLGYKSFDGSSSITDPAKLLANFDPNNSQYQKSVSDAFYHGEDYYEKAYLDRQSNLWATGKASISSTEIKANPVTKQINEQADKDWEHKLAWQALLMRKEQSDQRLDIEQLKAMKALGIPITDDMWEQAAPGNPFGGAGITGGSSFNPATGFGTTGASVGSGDVGEPGTDIQKVATYDAFKRDQEGERSAIVAQGLTYQGNLQLFNANNMPGGLSEAQLMDLSGQFQQGLTTGKYPMDEQSIATRKQFMELLKSEGVIKGDPNDYINVGPGKIVEYSNKLAVKYADSLKSNADGAKRQLGMDIMNQQHEVENMAMEYKKKEDAYKIARDAFLKTKEGAPYNRFIKHDNKDPKKDDFYTVADMVPHFPSLTIKVGNEEKELSPVQVADMYRNGTFDIVELNPARPRVKVDGKEGYVTAVNGKSMKQGWAVRDEDVNIGNDFERFFTGNAGRGMGVAAPGSIIGTFGRPGEMKKAMDTIGEKIVPQIPGYSTGLSGSVISYNIASEPGNKNPKLEAQKNTAIGITQELLRNPINFDDIYTTNGDNKKDASIPEDEKRALIEGSNRKDIYNLFGQAEYFPHGPNGKPAWKLSATSDSKGEKDRATIGGVDIKSLKGHQAIWIDISDNAKGDMLSQLPHPTNLYRWGRVFYDARNPITQTPYEEQSGFKYQIIPDPTSKGPDGRFSKAMVVTQKQMVDPVTGIPQTDKEGKIVWAPQSTKPVDLSTYNPDMLKETINKWILATMQENDLRRASHQATPQENAIDITNAFK